MTTALTTADTNYEALLQQFADLKAPCDAQTLRRLFHVGRLYTDFFDACGTQKYGNRRVASLAKDLTERGYLEGVHDPERLLYWAKNLFDFISTEEQLEVYSTKGLTLSHAKMLFPQTPSVIRNIEKKMYKDDGTIIGTAALRTLVLAEARAKSIETIVEENALKEVESSVVATEPVAPPHAIPGVAAAAPKDEAPAGSMEAGKEEAKVDKKASPASSSATPASPRVVSPLKCINGLEKTISKAVIDLPDALIALKETSKRGFESDKQEKNFKTAVANLKAALKDSIGPFQALLQEIIECE